MRVGPYRFLFFSNEGFEPPQVHVQRECALEKFWIAPLALCSLSNFPSHEIRRLHVLVEERQHEFEAAGMCSLDPKADPRATDVVISDDELSMELADGRRIVVPLAWFPRLLHATAQQRAGFELLGEGAGIHWPAIDEDLIVEGLLRGRSEPWALDAG